ncbi:hypothetical protein E2C01_039373 [Portunus trituberculatus]|uniref:Uncharacterized protein n=1 Tax=Portunus trituberculatus TaxID=210409 RepID=A0A5B7FJI0_PORTR|nr:hypothetical protein [Portunus trituberculatus]
MMARMQEDEHLASQQCALFCGAEVNRGYTFRDLPICSPVPVDACLQQHWIEWMEVGTGESLFGFIEGRCTVFFSFGFTKTQLPRDEFQSDFTIPALTEYVGDSEGHRLLCPVRAIREYPRRTRDCRLRCSRISVTVTEPQCVVHPHTISHWICQVIQCACEDVSEEDMRLVWVKAHEVRAVATSAFFKKIQSIPAVLWAGTWKSMSTFASFYLRDITHRYLDTFSLGPVVSALRIIH